jgi:hypothetical protein
MASSWRIGQGGPARVNRKTERMMAFAYSIGDLPQKSGS